MSGLVPTRALLIEPDAMHRAEYARAMSEAGIAVAAVASTEAALDVLALATTDVVVSEIGSALPSGTTLLGAIRDRDPDLPVILMTSVPDLDTAMLAVNLGAYRYLVKPVRPPELVDLVRRAALLRSFSRLRHEAVAAVETEDPMRHSLGARFDAALADIWMAYQPIVDIDHRQLLGVEALLRVDSHGFVGPEQLIGAAIRLERTRNLGRAVRSRVARDVPRLPAAADIFVNLLPQDLLDPALFEPNSAIARIAPRVVLELTERSSLEAIPELQRRVAALRALGFRIALDDLGVGYSGLASLTQLEPEIVKLDRSLIHGVHESARRRAVVRSMVSLCRSLDIAVIGEGVEREAEAEALRALKVGQLQGYLIGPPNRDFAWPRTPAH
jgi:EAL domain-containing protein (putative c-di-GMP-specific phosphodiesterase class I)